MQIINKIYSMKRQLFFHSLLIAVGALVFGGCNQDDDSGNLAKGGMIEVRFTVDGVSDYAGDTSAETRAPAEPFRVSVPMNEDYEIEATFVPRQAERTRAIGPLDDNIRYRVLAYKGGTTYSGYADYKIKNGKSVLENGGFRLSAGRYKFVAYSYYNSEIIPGIPDENTNLNELAVSTEDDIIYWQSDLITISGNTSLSIGFRHLFPQLQVIFDSTGFYYDLTSASAVLTVGNASPYINGVWTVANSYVDIVTTTQEDGAFKFSTTGSQRIASDLKRLLPISNTKYTPLDLTVGATFANGEKVSGKKLSLAVANNELKNNTSYVCTVKFKQLGFLEGDEINGYPYGGGNCWVIPKKPGDATYSFTAVEGRSNDPIGTTVNDKGVPNGTSVVWQMDADGNSCSGLIKSSGYYPSSNQMSFTVGGGKVGNALLAVKSSTGAILWSWHIWVVSDNSFMTNPIKINGVGEFMDRNLGANRDGSNRENMLYYQWGRKDPLTYNNQDMKAGPVSISVATQNPGYIYKDNSSKHWCNDNSALWSPTPTNRSMLKYDPSPKGWTIPSSATYSLLAAQQGGVVSNHICSIPGTNGTLYFPAVGMKNSGTTDDVAVTLFDYGYYSSVNSSTDGIATMFYFNSSIIQPSSSARQSALPIRCIRE